jgi:hypothetical protein
MLVFWVLTPFEPLGRYALVEHTALIVRAEKGGGMHLKNFGICSPHGLTTQKTNIDITTSNLMYNLLFRCNLPLCNQCATEFMALREAF